LSAVLEPPPLKHGFEDIMQHLQKSQINGKCFISLQKHLIKNFQSDWSKAFVGQYSPADKL